MIERLVACLIERLDEEDGDIDLLEASDAEDDFVLTYRASRIAAECGPGDAISDAGEDIADAECEQWNYPDDCSEDVFLGRRRPARQITDD